MRNSAGILPPGIADAPTEPQQTVGLEQASNDATEALAAEGRERGFLTSEDVRRRLPEAELSPEQVEEFLAHVEQVLQDEGIEIIEDPEDDAEGGVGTDQALSPPRRDPLRSPNYDPVRMYLKEVGRVPLLSAPQEVDLAMRIEAGELAGELLASVGVSGRVDRTRFRGVMDSVARIRRHQLDPENGLHPEGIGRERFPRSHRPKTSAEAVELLHRVQLDAGAARRHLIEANLRLVVSIAKRYPNRGMAFLDLTQEGNLGLIRAVQKFDHTRGFKFSTYATWWIRQAISRAIADQSRVIRIPVHMTEHLNRVSRAQRDLAQTLGREPTPEEVGARIGLSAEKVSEVLRMSRDPLSLETPIGEDEDARLMEFIEDRDAVEPPDAAIMGIVQGEVASVLRTLSVRERRIVELRFGLNDGRPRTLEEVGVEFGITRERIRQIEAKTLSKLRHPSRAHRLRDSVEDQG